MHQFTNAPLGLLDVHEKDRSCRHDATFQQLPDDRGQWIGMEDPPDTDFGLRIVTEDVLEIRIERGGDVAC